VRSAWRLALLAAIVAYGGVILGSWVRITGSGMSCPDWPLCHGSVLPSLAAGSFWEWSHRLVALFEAPLVIALAAMAWPLRNAASPVKWMLALVLALFGFQIFLGAATVHLSNSPISVVLHWGTAMAFLGSLVALTVFMRAPAIVTNRSSAGHHLFSALLGVTTLLAFVTMCVGAYVSSSGAGLACIHLPGCAGEVVVYGSSQFVQMVHRVAAGSCLFAACATTALAWRYASRASSVLTTTGLALLFMQVIFGLLNVAWRLPVAVRELHSATAALAFLSFVAALALDATEIVARRPQRAGA